MKKFLIIVIGVAALLAVLEAVEMVRFDKWHCGAIFVAVALPLIILFARPKPARDASELGDDDGGVDWRERNAVGEMVQMWNGWAVLLGDVPVHEAKALSERLESSQIRCRLELLKEDRAFHLYGNWGMGTRMCVLVAPSDYANAKKLLSPKE